MQNTRDIERVGTALIDLMSFFASPQRDEALLREAGVAIDRALFPLLVRLERLGPLSVGSLAAQVGRDHTTISRQLSKLESLGLIIRPNVTSDRRIRTAALAKGGEVIVDAITTARARLLTTVLADWSDADRASLGSLNRRFVDALAAAAA